MGATYCNCIHVCCVYCIAEHSINRWCYTVNKSRFLEKSCLVKNYAPVLIILLNQLGFILYFSCNLKKNVIYLLSLLKFKVQIESGEGKQFCKVA